MGLLFGAFIAFGFAADRIETGPDEYGLVLTGVPFLLYLVFVLSYYFIAEWANGQTLGKRWLGIRVTDTSGARAGTGAVAIRTVLRLIDWLPFLYLVGYIAIRASGERGQRLGDMAARTSVRAAEDAPHPAAIPPLAAAAAMAIVAALTLAGTAAWSDGEPGFIASADEICERRQAQSSGLEAQLRVAESPRDAVAVLGQVERIARAGARELAALDPPDSLSDIWPRYLDSVNAQPDRVAQARRAVERNDRDAFARANAELARGQAERAQLLEEFDFEHCG